MDFRPAQIVLLVLLLSVVLTAVQLGCQAAPTAQTGWQPYERVWLRIRSGARLATGRLDWIELNAPKGATMGQILAQHFGGQVGADEDEDSDLDLHLYQVSPIDSSKTLGELELKGAKLYLANEDLLAR